MTLKCDIQHFGNLGRRQVQIKKELNEIEEKEDEIDLDEKERITKEF